MSSKGAEVTVDWAARVATRILGDLIADRIGWTFCLRTGPKEFTTALVNVVKPWGFYFEDGRLMRESAGPFQPPEMIATPSESALFEAIGLPFIGVPHRHPVRLRALANQRGV